MDRLKKYSKVLGITKSVSAKELKFLYRMRAKELHPDSNNPSSSHEQFVLLNEAYEFYRQLLKRMEDDKKAAFIKSKKYPKKYYYESWNVEKRMAARRNAAKKAQMKYEHFEKQGYYKTLDRLFYFFDLLRFIIALALLICMPIFLFYQDQFKGLIVAMIIQLVTYKLWSRAIRRFIPFN